VGARINVHEQHSFPQLGQGCTQVDYGRRFSHSPFMVDNADNSGSFVVHEFSILYGNALCQILCFLP
jgi:hypothetical protein